MSRGVSDRASRTTRNTRPGESPLTPCEQRTAAEVRYYDPAAAKGSRWSKAGVSSIPRMYHSTATLLPDGTVLVSGSNPSADCQCSLQVAFGRGTDIQTSTRTTLLPEPSITRSIKSRSSTQTSMSSQLCYLRAKLIRQPRPSKAGTDRHAHSLHL